MNFNNKIKQKQIIIEHFVRSNEGKSMLTIYEAMTINILAYYIGDGSKNNNTCWEDQKELARSCYMSLPQLKKTIKSLKEKKIINVKREKYRNYYSFNPFWLDEVMKYSSHLEAVKAFTAKPDSSNRASDSSNRAISHIYNNINNNSEKLSTGAQKITRKSDNFDNPAPNGKIHPLLADYLKDMSGKGGH